jgi:diguanylate cyclase (GGDEF)-like protein/PAS domain S-box-containing protein
MTAVRRIPMWGAYLAFGVVLTAAYVWAPGVAGSGPLFNLLGIAPVAAIAVGMRVHRPASRAPWWLFLIGFALFWLGDVYTYSYPKAFGGEVPFPSPGDAAYVAVYPALMAGLLVLVRRRNPETDRAGVIDSLIITLGLALFSWVGLIAPYLHDHELSLLGKLTSVAYPLGDVLLLAAAIRLAVDSGRRQRAFYLLVASIVALLVTDFTYGLAILYGTYDHQLIYDVGWIAFYLLWGAAALHPSMRGLDEPVRGRETRLTRSRLVLLGIASLVAPAIELTKEWAGGDADLLVIIGVSVVLFAFVVVRMTGLIRQHERSVDRERTLSAAGAALAAASSRQEIFDAALEAALALAGDDARGVVCATAEEAAAAAGAIRLTAPDRPTLVLDLAQRDADESAALVIAGRSLSAGPEQRSLQALAAEVSLALASAALTEEIHRHTSEARLSSLVRHASDLITVLDPGGVIVYQSPSVERILGHSADELAGTRFDRLIAPDDPGRLSRILADDAVNATATGELVECLLLHRDGSVRHFEIQHTNLLHDEHVGGIVLNGRDVSERRAFELQLEHQAFHDPVTSLANRALFVERVRHAVARSRREGNGIAVIFLDLDDFKTINDSLGHAAGDAVLVDVAKRLSDSIRSSDTAARFGGDEFAVLLEDVASAQEAADTAERILAAFADPLALDHKDLAVRASLGISVSESHAAGDAEELIRNADAAMYIAKRDGKGGYRLFEPAMHEGVLARLELRADLQRAISGGELELFYQPVIRLEEGSVSGVEALLRWRHPQRGMVAPDEFIGLAEEMGLIVPIGRWVLREGCRQARILQALVPSDPPLTMSVNLSVKQLQHAGIVEDVREALHESDLDPATLTLEITETVMMTDTDLVIARLQELKGLGVRLAMDDFGTGYSSLSYLSRLPVDILKMDRSFLHAGASPQASGLATAVVALGQTLSLEVVAEGIEFPDQWSKLRELGCDLGQGFYFARPMDADATVTYLRSAGRPADAAPNVP